jgi:hypothetical protein
LQRHPWNFVNILSHISTGKNLRAWKHVSVSPGHWFTPWYWPRLCWVDQRDLK